MKLLLNLVKLPKRFSKITVNSHQCCDLYLSWTASLWIFFLFLKKKMLAYCWIDWNLFGVTPAPAFQLSPDPCPLLCRCSVVVAVHWSSQYVPRSFSSISLLLRLQDKCHQQPVVTDQWSTAGPSAISSALRLHPSFCLHVTPRPVFPVFSNSSSPSCPLQRQINEGLPWYWWGVVGGGLGWLRRYWSTGVVKDVWCHTGIFF